MRRLNHHGFSLIEAVASVFIITLILTTAITIIINVRNHTQATNNRINAIEIGTQIRDNLINDTSYVNLSTWMNGTQKTVNHLTCGGSSPISCNYFNQFLNGVSISNQIVITFFAQTANDITYQIVHFEITITYYSTRTITLEGMVYE
jgi:predicted PurR-regulated permease PerM